MIGKLHWGVYFACVGFGIAGYVAGMCNGSLMAREAGYVKICRDWVREHAWDMEQREYMTAIAACEVLVEEIIDD